MHVSTESPISGAEALTRLRTVTGATGREEADASRLRGEFDRQPPKLFLGRLPLVPPAAEIMTADQEDGSEVVLRLMWGPLPAPFPRALAAAGVLAAALLLWTTSGAWPQMLIAVLMSGLPIAALLYQRAGERTLQQRVGAVLGGTGFSPKPH